MKILIITQIVDVHDPILGFFHRWIEEFARDCEQVVVITLKEGEHQLPPNVKVLSLGKEQGTSKLEKLRRLYRFVLSNRKEYSHVFVHMNHEYILLCGLLFKLLRKRISLWYVHKSVTLKLRIAELFCDAIFTASKESFRLVTPKLHIIGHGIDTIFFSPDGRENQERNSTHLLSAGRISFAKHHDLLIRALALLPANFDLSIAGAPLTEMDRGYENKLKKLVRELRVDERVHFLGSMDQAGLRECYKKSDVFVHASTTGSYDKVVLEALASGVPVLSSSEAFADHALPVEMVEHKPEAFAEKLKVLARSDVDPYALAAAVKEKHSIENCIKTILTTFERV